MSRWYGTIYGTNRRFRGETPWALNIYNDAIGTMHATPGHHADRLQMIEIAKLQPPKLLPAIDHRNVFIPLSEFESATFRQTGGYYHRVELFRVDGEPLSMYFRAHGVVLGGAAGALELAFGSKLTMRMPRNKLMAHPRITVMGTNRPEPSGLPEIEESV